MAQLFTIPFANNGTKRRPPLTDPAFNVNFEQGYTPQYEINLSTNDPDARAVERDIFNWMFYSLTQVAAEWQKQSFPVWQDHPSGYDKNAFVQYNGRLYRSLKDANKSAVNAVADWEFQEDLATVKSYIPQIYGGASGPSTGLVSAAKDFNTLERGFWFIASAAVFNGCANKPPMTVAGPCTVESFFEVVSVKKQGVQTVKSTVNGEIWTRAMVDGVWSTAWTQLTNSSDVQSGKYAYAQMSNGSAANNYKADFSPQIKTLVAGMRLTLDCVAAVNQNTGDVSVSINGLPAIRIISGDHTDLPAGIIKPYTRLEILVLSPTIAVVMSIAGGAIADSKFGQIPLDLYMNEAYKALIPIGVPIPVPYTALPDTWAIMEGNKFDKVANPQLFAIYPSEYLPDLRGCAIIGLDRGKGYDANRTLLSYQADQVGSHDHAISVVANGDHNHTVTIGSSGAHAHTGTAAAAGAGNYSVSTQASMPVTVGNAGSHQHWNGIITRGVAGNFPYGYQTVGTAQSYEHHQNNGNMMGRTDMSPTHSHSASTVAHAHTVAIGNHTHSVSIPSGGAHTHTGSTGNAGSHSHAATAAVNAPVGTPTRIKNVAFVWACRMR